MAPPRSLRRTDARVLRARAPDIRAAASWSWLLLACAAACCLGLLSGCADETPAPTAPASVAAAPATVPAPAAAPAGTAVLANDPSAPADTPLCGTAARERSAIDQALLPRQYADAGICRTFACYDPATATYIGADGYRHVCR